MSENSRYRTIAYGLAAPVEIVEEKEKEEKVSRFMGYGRPNYTPIPDEFLDEQMFELSEAELKVLLYIMRRTFGFKKWADKISYDQFLNGITTQAGKQLDRGAGVSASSLKTALKSLVDRGYIFKHSSQTEQGVNKTNIYELNFDGIPHYQEGGDGSKSALPIGQNLTNRRPKSGLSNERKGRPKFDPTIIQLTNKQINDLPAIDSELDSDPGPIEQQSIYRVDQLLRMQLGIPQVHHFRHLAISKDGTKLEVKLFSSAFESEINPAWLPVLRRIYPGLQEVRVL
jgi:hypothetical protein